MKETVRSDGRECIYTPNSLRATTSLRPGIYDKRRRTSGESASHDVPI